MGAANQAPVQRPDNSYGRYWQAPFNRPAYYPLDRRPTPDLYQPIGEWMGRLILPPLAQREQVRGTLIEIHHAPAGHDGLVGTVVRLRWADTAATNKIYWSLTRQVLFDGRARKAVAEGTVLPERIQGLSLVNPFESLAGAHPNDDIVVRLPEPVTLDAAPADGGAPILFVPRQPVQITGRFYALVKFLAAEGDDEHYRVVHYSRDSAAFDGPAEVVHMPLVVANQDGVMPFTNAGIEHALAGVDGWYIYGACDREGVFVVQALAPRQLLRLAPTRVIASQEEALRYVGKQGIKNAAAHKGQAMNVFLPPPGVDPQAAQADWCEGDDALLIHVYGGIGGEQAEPALKASPLYWGHFAFGVARVVREPIADELSFDIEYLQVYAHNPDGLTSGALHWSRYIGDRQYGWLGTRPVRDVLVRLPCFTGRRGQTSVTPLALTRRYLEMMTARYRIGGGAGSSLVTPAYNCAQDSNQALYAAFKVIAQNLTWQDRQTLTAGDSAHEQDLADLMALGNDLERYLVPFGGARSDWASDAGVLGGSADMGGLANLFTALRSWRTMLPSVAARTLVAIFLRHGAAAWVLDTYQCGGVNPHISPVMPNV
ncbi:hypothetical protein EYB53_024240 [Candidatus Chloroploca sp. M-50]|uniref:Uncharacterized protein n=1 Tax=Candidatus Chloroploca mongolica TaxID=2528176 RepID=A0ABS4DHE3_9CHLR|nr:hypothetical protein [Candidatus Chloroploca mongolica]MBP1468843.1 hypothetical protein [Candidatus Chloroploca mongolica]